MTCPEMNKKMAELLFERPLPEDARKHIGECAACAGELVAMEKTWNLLDEWQAPEPSPFFDAKLYARLRAEQTIAPATFFERAKAWLLYGSNLQLRQLAAVSLAAAMVIGGGTFALLDYRAVSPAPTSATVRDLQSFDGNAQLFQQLNALDGDEDGAAGASN